MGVYFSNVTDGKNPTTLRLLSRKGTFQPTTCMIPLVILMPIFASEDWYGQEAQLSLTLQTTFILILLIFNFLTSTFFWWVYYTMLEWMINKKTSLFPNVALLYLFGSSLEPQYDRKFISVLIPTVQISCYFTWGSGLYVADTYHHTRIGEINLTIRWALNSGMI